MNKLEDHIVINVDNDKYWSVSPYSHSVFIAMLMQGKNPVSISYGEIQGITHFGKATISRSIKELDVAGFITVHSRGRFRGDKSEYILNPEFGLRVA